MYLLNFFSYNTFCHLRLIYHMRLVLGDYRDFSCKMSLATKIQLQTLVENTQFSSSVIGRLRCTYGIFQQVIGKNFRWNKFLGTSPCNDSFSNLSSLGGHSSSNQHPSNIGHAFATSAQTKFFPKMCWRISSCQ